MRQGQYLAGLVSVGATVALALGLACLSPAMSPTGAADGDGAVNRQNSPDTDFVSPDAALDVAVGAVGSGGLAMVTQENAAVRADVAADVDAQVDVGLDVGLGVGNVTGLAIDYRQAMPFSLAALLMFQSFLSHRREMLRIRMCVKRDAVAVAGQPP